MALGRHHYLLLTLGLLLGLTVMPWPAGNGVAHAQMLTGYGGNGQAEGTGKPLDTPPPLIPPDSVTGAYQPFLTAPDPEPVAQQPAMQAMPLLIDEPAPVTAEPDATYSNRPPPRLTAPDVAAAPVPQAGADPEAAPVDLTADMLEHDDETNIVTASGNVELVQAGRILRAQEVSYNLNTGTARAQGHVVLNEPNGDIHFADEVELSREMTDGFVVGLQSYLSDGGRFRARRAERVNSQLLTLHDASFTPCECNVDEDGDPTWQIRAERVIYNEAEHKISYKNARFEIFGTPVLWTPYLAHSDGKVERKSGLLSPDMGYDSELGFIYAQNYYWAIAPHRDATFGMMLTTQKNPVGLLQYRQRFAHAEMQLGGSFTRSDRTDSIGGRDVALPDEWRGHLFADARWDITDKWRAGADLELTSDDQYLRQYDFSDDDVLENEIYAERFSGRHYAVVRALAFQDVRVQEEQTDQPNILPEAVVNFIGEPNATLGGRWEVEATALGLTRDGKGQDMARGTLTAGWKRRETTSFGLVNTLDLSVRGDAYSINDSITAPSGSGRSGDSTATRFFPQAHLVSSMPFVKPLRRSQILVEPVAALTLSTNVDFDDNIPNEDSQDVQLDTANLLEPNRFPGYDRIEDRARVTYGLRSGIYGHDGARLTGFIGQSYNFDDDNTIFPEGSGLSGQNSDVVGSIAALYDNSYGLNYRFQVDGDNLTSERHELDGFAYWQKLSLNSRYLYAKGLEGTRLTESREQAEAQLAYFFTEQWRSRLGAVYDFGEDSGLRRVTAGVDYFGCCLNFSLTAERSLTSDSSGDSGTDVMFRVGLKGMGEFQNARDNYWGGTTPRQF